MQIALFDLDHTLIPFDSGGAFTSHMATLGAIGPEFAPKYLDYCRRYAAGEVDMREMHRFTVGALGVHPPAQLQAWLDDFRHAIDASFPAKARALVKSHQEAGHACALVTATTRFVAAAYGAAAGLETVIATEPERDEAGHFTGGIIGEPCFREHKIAHVEGWLAGLGITWETVERSWFYSDSINDLPLLSHVSDPVVVDPDPMLREEAARRGWPILSLKG